MIFLPPTAGNENGSVLSSNMAGVAAWMVWTGVGFDNRILRYINRLGYIRQSKIRPLMNKAG